MRKKFFFILILLLSFNLSNTSAQDVPDIPKTISGGILNGKATSLPKPVYPAAARVANVGGVVLVQVKIDEKGDVISASAVSGHPLLRQACEQAALATKFSPTKVSGQLVRITGTLVYNFVPAMSFTQIGYELSLAKSTRSISKSRLADIRGTFRQDWETEREIAKKLDSFLINKITEKENNALNNPSEITKPTENKGIEGDSRKTVQGDKLEFKGDRTVQGNNALVATSASQGTYSLDENSISIINELQSKLETRLDVNENMVWAYKLGTILGRLNAEIANDEKTQTNIADLELLNANRPASISETVATKLKELVETSKKTATASNRTERLLPLIESLRDLQ